MRIELVLTPAEVLCVRNIIRHTEEEADILASSNCISQIDKKFYQEELECCKKVGKLFDLALAEIV